MSFSVKYKELFTIRIMHRFFLNKGNDDFDSLTEEEQGRQLEEYDFQRFFKIEPTAETWQALNGQKMIFHPGKTGFSVWTEVESADEQSPFIAMDENLVLTFTVQFGDSCFFNYSDLDIGISNGLFYFSNQRLPEEGGDFPLIPLSGGDGIIDDNFVLSAVSAEEELGNLPPDKTKNLFGLIRIFMKGEDSSRDITDVQDKIPGTPAAFHLEFGNRKTWWRYVFDEEQSVSGADDVEVENGDARILISKTDHPLTLNGFISLELDKEELPNPGYKMIKPDISNNKIYSEINM